MKQKRCILRDGVLFLLTYESTVKYKRWFWHRSAGSNYKANFIVVFFLRAKEESLLILLVLPIHLLSLFTV